MLPLRFMFNESEPQLIALGKAGDTAATGILFERHYRASLHAARRILSSDAEAQDAVQAAYLAAFRSLRSFRGESSFRTFITRIVVNRCLMAIREPWRSLVIGHAEFYQGASSSDCFVSHFPSPEKSAYSRELETAHSRAICSLPPPQRDAYVLYAVKGYSVEEVANAMAITVPAAKSRIARARDAVLSTLKTEWSTCGTGERPCR